MPTWPVPFAAMRILSAFKKRTWMKGMSQRSELRPLRLGTKSSLVAQLRSRWMVPKYGNDMCNMKSTTGYVFYLGGAAITWRSRRQSTFATSTAHSECNAAYEAGCEAVYLRKLMRDLGNPQVEPTLLHEDNQALIKISQKPKIKNAPNIGIPRYLRCAK